MKKALRQSVALNEPHGPGIAIGHDTLRVARRDLSKAGGNLGDCHRPRHRLKLPRAFRPGSAQRLSQTIRMMRAFRIAGHFRAQNTVRRRMVGIPLDSNNTVAADGYPQRAGIGTIMRASRANRAFLFYGRHICARSKVSAILNRSS